MCAMAVMRFVLLHVLLHVLLAAVLYVQVDTLNVHIVPHTHTMMSAG